MSGGIVGCGNVHSALAVGHVVLPLALVAVAPGVGEGDRSDLLGVLEDAGVALAVDRDEAAGALVLAVQPLPFVQRPVLGDHQPDAAELLLSPLPDILGVAHPRAAKGIAGRDR